MSRLLHSLPVALLRAAHPRQALATALLLAVAAGLAGRPLREAALVLATVLVGQALQGWHNDLTDRAVDLRHDRPSKPVAQGDLDPGTVAFALACGLLLLVPLSMASGLVAGTAYLLAVGIGLLANLVLRRGLLSWLPWALQFALYPAFLAYGGWAGVGTATPPEPALSALAALLGVCVHVLRSLPGLVLDHQDDVRSLPMRLALAVGAPRLLWLTLAATALVAAAILIVAQDVGLAR